ncbi:hypothetical protein [Reichenbachiella agariperforans]|uniref:hypothetical protein n=1 Tax=Reichenbachiella agariperforans TaxID=156994 RepID=UPI001C09255E|nr:hypothetical protein [Reichenbachiella agariperforans]MBU2913727.1 hypothetical protein [Reichenbachiella agariperforans]
MTPNHYHIDIRNNKKFLDFLNGKEPYFEISSDYIFNIGFDCIPLEGFEKPKDYPKCCRFHEKTLQNLNNWYRSFPLCCKQHQELTTKSWWKDGIYDHIPNRIITHELYCEHAISKFINNETWYEEITEYFDYAIHSFGTPSIGLDQFLNTLRFYILNATPDWQFSKEKRGLLVGYIDAWLNPSSNKFDLNACHEKIQKWAKLLPDITPFKNIKKKLSEGLQMNLMVQGPIVHNKYLNIGKVQTKSKKELVESLISLTKALLLHIQDQIKKGNLRAHNDYKIEVINAEHEIKQNLLLIDFSKGERKYINIIKSWLKNEKEHLNDLLALIEPNQISADYFISQIKTFGINLENQERLYNNFGEDEFRDQFISHLNSLSEEANVTSETFNKIGKVDILVRNNLGHNLLVCECKLWKGKQKFLEAIDQLILRYISWSNDNGAIIIFNTEHKTFSNLINDTKEFVTEHSSYIRTIEANDRFFKCSFKHPEDDNKTLDLDFILFNYLKK